MKKRNRKPPVAPSVPAHLDESPASAGSRLVRELGTDDGIRAFLDWSTERKEWSDANGVALDPLDYERTGLPQGVTQWRYGPKDVRPRSEF